MSSATNPRVVVIGSMNIDHVTQVDELPCRGATVNSIDYEIFRGGKGANQAIAASRQEVEVSLIGSIGNDEQGTSYLKYLKEEIGIDVSGVSQSNEPTGSAFVTVEKNSGHNQIVIASGANANLSRTDIKDLKKVIKSGSALLVQFEVSTQPILDAMHLAVKAGIPTVVNPSPFIPTFPWEEVSTDHVIVNEGEAAELLISEKGDYEFVREELHSRRIKNLIITRGSGTTLVYSQDGDFFEVEPLPVLPIDTVGAGDAFAGCFAARIAEGKSVEDAVRAANCAGALTTLGGGAQHPIPDRERVEQHLEQIPKRRKVVR